MEEKFLVAPEKYTNIDEFIREFTNDYNDKFEVWWGLDFTYNGKDYHFCRYPTEDDESRELFEKLLNRDLSKTVYELVSYEKEDRNEFTINDHSTIIGWYDTIEDALESRVIENTSFKDILLSDEIILTGRD